MRYTNLMPRAKGPAIQILPGWVKKVLVRLDEPDWNQERLAKAVGYDQGTVSRALSNLRGGMDLFSKIADALELPRPWILVTEREDAEWFELGKIIRELDRPQYERLRKIVEKTADTVEKIHEQAELLGIAPELEGSEGPDKTTEHESSESGQPGHRRTPRPPPRGET